MTDSEQPTMETLFQTIWTDGDISPAIHSNRAWMRFLAYFSRKSLRIVVGLMRCTRR